MVNNSDRNVVDFISHVTDQNDINPELVSWLLFSFKALNRDWRQEEDGRPVMFLYHVFTLIRIRLCHFFAEISWFIKMFELSNFTGTRRYNSLETPGVTLLRRFHLEIFKLLLFSLLRVIEYESNSMIYYYPETIRRLTPIKYKPEFQLT